MGENTRLEDCTIRLTSTGHYNLTCILFSGSTTTTGKLRTCVATVDNSTASTVGGAGTVINCINANGVGGLAEGSFSFNSLKGSTLNVYSNGAGTKRGILISGGTVSVTNTLTTRDLNIYVKTPTDTASTGSYIGIETTSQYCQIQCRSTTISGPVQTGSFTSSDIKQTMGSIQLGPGVDIINKTAGGYNFTAYIYPTVIYYGVLGTISRAQIITGYLWPGTVPAQKEITTGNPVKGYPDSIIGYYRAQQKCILAGMYCTMSIPPGTGYSTIVTVMKNDVDTDFKLSFGPTDTSLSAYVSSVTYQLYDRLSVRVGIGNLANASHDLSLQMDIF